MFGRNRNRRNSVADAILMEAVEPRRLLSAAASASVTDHLLSVVGTNHSDEIVVALDSVDATMLDVMINGVEVGSFAVSDVTGINVMGGNGHDHITIENTLDIPATVLGGNGRDTINGGMAADSLVGGNGKDDLAGGLGNDSMNGGGGKDDLNGGDGDDVVFGGQGQDDLHGDADSDTVMGGAGDDSVDGGDGDDLLNGNAGDDDVDGGDGTDEIRGGRGHDVFHGHDKAGEKRDKHDGESEEEDEDGVLG